MPKFFVEESQVVGSDVCILGQDVKHIKRVLRAKVNDVIEVCNTDSGENYLCNIVNILEDKILCIIKDSFERNVESNILVSIFQGLPKADKMEYIIQKSVELGGYDIFPVEMRRCVVKLDNKDKCKKVSRWQKISEVAAKQCGRDIIPKVNDVINIKNLCNLIEKYDIVFVAYESEKQNNLKNQLKSLKDSMKEDRLLKIGIVIGPEGGLDLEDVELLRRNNAQVITLGNRIIRTETVALNMLSIIMYELEN